MWCRAKGKRRLTRTNIHTSGSLFTRLCPSWGQGQGVSGRTGTETQTFIRYLHRLALQQGEVKGRSVEERLAFEAVEAPQAAARSFAQKLDRETKLRYVVEYFSPMYWMVPQMNGSEGTFGDVTQHLVERNSDGGRERERYHRTDSHHPIRIKPYTWRVSVSVHELYLKVFVPRHRFVGEFGQEHGDEPREAPLGSHLARADARQPQHVLRDVGRFAVEHSMLAQAQGGRRQAAQACWDRQAHAREEATPPGRECDGDSSAVSPARLLIQPLTSS
ncbi:hypothetical protein EYF80_026305 [Liparis tanakae]|uniref:Uncharacterized protein n=1 Tax=Liparis tanakae TaxID=230148 RepID=A0A4Z2HDW4_9TELE|nr:hypothetical protein EYF80_026305 [Liparis tanakae]